MGDKTNRQGVMVRKEITKTDFLKYQKRLMKSLTPDDCTILTSWFGLLTQEENKRGRYSNINI